MDKALTVIVFLFPSVTVMNQEATVTCVCLVWSCQQVRVRISEIHGPAQTSLQHSSGRDLCPGPELKCVLMQLLHQGGRSFQQGCPQLFLVQPFTAGSFQVHSVRACLHSGRQTPAKVGGGCRAGGGALRAVSKATALCSVQ